MHELLHVIFHALGIDTQTSMEYCFWSGAGTQLTLCIAAVMFLRHHNCHVKGCWRLGHIDAEHGHPACRRHHSQAHKLGAAP